MSLNVQKTVHLLSIPYDIANYINSFLFHDIHVGRVRALKKKVCEFFFRIPLHLNKWQTINFRDKITRQMYIAQQIPINHVSRLTYTCQNGFWEERPTSLYIYIKDGEKRRSFWSGFCGDCGDYTSIMQHDDWLDLAGRGQYSPNTDVLCLCGLSGYINLGLVSRRRPYPLGRVVGWE